MFAIIEIKIVMLFHETLGQENRAAEPKKDVYILSITRIPVPGNWSILWRKSMPSARV